ncbi:STAS domain-containing protein [Microbispora sp. NBC_01189]|uniref:STAS domain-containing protein n=1 Tax=Microbispora sp. NBC_01189 TaxID=2903583 RepID=UPI002E0F8525|nr:STAS domain-containing protein [Microbispora sp. NBC_01189]
MSVSGPRSTLKVASVSRGDALVVRMQGDLDAGTAHLLREELRQVWESSTTSVLVIDVAEVMFCDSRGLSELISALQRGQAANVRLILTGVQGVLRRVLTITGLRKVFEQHATVEEALAGASDAGPRQPRGPEMGGLYEIAGDR